MSLKNRVDLAKYLGSQGYKTGVEVGVGNGEFGKVLCKNIPGLKYTGIDSWEVDGRSTAETRAQNSLARKNLSPFSSRLVKNYSLKAVHDFKDSSLDFVYIDADKRFDEVARDIIEWTKKVKKGGIVAGNGYRAGTKNGVISAVNGYTKGHSFRLNLTDDKNWWFTKKWNV